MLLFGNTLTNSTLLILNPPPTLKHPEILVGDGVGVIVVVVVGVTV